MTDSAPQTSPLDVFSGRFVQVEALFQDPGYAIFRAEDRERHGAVRVQFFSAPTLENDEHLTRQWEAIRGLPDRLWFRARELIRRKESAAMLSWSPPGRSLGQVQGTLPDEVTLKWLGEALRDLEVLHRAGLLHLSQQEDTWLLFQGEEEGQEIQESLGLGSLYLFPDLMLGGRATAPVFAAVAPEMLAGEEVDERADLYSLACLLFSQRAVHGLGSISSSAQWLEAHRSGRFLELLPQSASPLNDLLRQMLQPDPKERPRTTVAALQRLFPHEKFPLPTLLPDFSAERVRRRQSNLILSGLYSLIREGEEAAACAWMERLADPFKKAHEPYLHYLLALAHRRQKNPAAARESREQAIYSLPERQDKKLQVLLLLEEVRSLDPTEDPDQLRSLLAQAQLLAGEYPDADLQAKVLVEQAALLKAERRDTEAMDALEEAEHRTASLSQCLVRGKVLRDLADLMAQYGMAAAALPLSHEALAAVESEATERARRHVEVGLIEARCKNFTQAREHFAEGKYLFSTRKDLEALVWATAHEVRGDLWQGDLKRARRELKALRIRARPLAAHQELLDMVELQLWLESGEGVDPQFESWKQRLEERMEGAQHGKPFREWVWAPAETLELFAKFARKLGRTELAAPFQARATELQDQMHSHLAESGIYEKYPLAPADTFEPMAEPVSVAGKAEAAPEGQELRDEESRRLREENRQLRARISALESEVGRLKEKKAAAPARSSAPRAPASPRPSAAVAPQSGAKEAPVMPVSSGDEGSWIEEALRRHRGNRNQTAKELKIHRRTLFEKMQKYGLDELSFDPNREDVLRALEECQGKKNLAAEKLGLSRSSFYRRLKELGLG